MDRNMILQQISDATSLLIQLYSDNSIQYFGLNAFEPNPVNEFIPTAVASGHTLVYSYSPEYLFGGFIRITDTSDYIIIGPVPFLSLPPRQGKENSKRHGTPRNPCESAYTLVAIHAYI